MAGNTKDEDRAIAKTCRSAAARVNLDLGEVIIDCSGGYIEIIGKVRGPRGAAGTVNVRAELKTLVTILGTVRGVKGVQSSRALIFD